MSAQNKKMYNLICCNLVKCQVTDFVFLLYYGMLQWGAAVSLWYNPLYAILAELFQPFEYKHAWIFWLFCVKIQNLSQGILGWFFQLANKHVPMAWSAATCLSFSTALKVYLENVQVTEFGFWLHHIPQQDTAVVRHTDTA